MTRALAVDCLTKSYGSRLVLDGVSFTLEAGTLTVLAGANGAGKSTLLRCLAGLSRFQGVASVGDQPLDGSPAARRRIAYVPQRVSLPESGTVGEVLALFGQLRGVPQSQSLFPAGFVPAPDRRLGVLSGGQQQRVVLAAAMLGEPAVLLLDEPAANLDAAGRRALWEGLRAAAGRGAAVLVASPSPGDLAGVADRELTLDEGRMVADAAWDRLRVARPGGVTPPGALAREAGA